MVSELLATIGADAEEEKSAASALERITAELELDVITSAVEIEAMMADEATTLVLPPELAQAKLILVTRVPESRGALKSQVIST